MPLNLISFPSCSFIFSWHGSCSNGCQDHLFCKVFKKTCKLVIFSKLCITIFHMSPFKSKQLLFIVRVEQIVDVLRHLNVVPKLSVAANLLQWPFASTETNKWHIFAIPYKMREPFLELTKVLLSALSHPNVLSMHWAEQNWQGHGKQ